LGIKYNWNLKKKNRVDWKQNEQWKIGECFINKNDVIRNLKFISWKRRNFERLGSLKVIKQINCFRIRF